MLDRLEKSGIGKRWQKNGMDRFYINMDQVLSKEFDEIPVRNYFNRYEIQNLKVYYDVIKDEFIVTSGDSRAKEAVIATINSMI